MLLMAIGSWKNTSSSFRHLKAALREIRMKASDLGHDLLNCVYVSIH